MRFRPRKQTTPTRLQLPLQLLQQLSIVLAILLSQTIIITTTKQTVRRTANRNTIAIVRTINSKTIYPPALMPIVAQAMLKEAKERTSQLDLPIIARMLAQHQIAMHISRIARIDRLVAASEAVEVVAIPIQIVPMSNSVLAMIGQPQSTQRVKLAEAIIKIIRHKILIKIIEMLVILQLQQLLVVLLARIISMIIAEQT